MNDEQIMSLQSEAGFRALFQYATVGILVIGSDGRIEHSNPCIEKLFDYTVTELIGQPLEILMPEAFRAKHAAHRDGFFKKPKARSMGYGLNLFARKKDGSEFPVEISLGHYQLGSNKLAVAFITDISQQKRAEAELLESKRKLDDEAVLLQQLNEACNRLWQLDDIDEGLQEMLAYSTKLFNANMGNVQIYDDRKKALAIAASKGFSKEFLEYFAEVAADDGTVCAQALRNSRQIIVDDVEKDTELAPHIHIIRNAGVKSVQSTPLTNKDGTPIGMISTHLEKTGSFDAFSVRIMQLYARQAESFIRRVRITEQLEEMNQNLEAKVQERTLELTQSLEREMELNEMKTRFVSMASHEFRTPLSSILSSATLIDSYVKEEHSEKRKKHTERIKSSVKNLVDIINDFLSLDKLEQGKVEVINEIFDLKDFAKDIIEEMDGTLKPGQQIKLSYTGENAIIQDKKILKNVLLNLLSNAVKYSKEDKNIHFSIETGPTVSIKVRDEGIGIPEEEKKHLFEKFFRASNAVNIQGTGLGLNIVKRYVELLGGAISFTSAPNQGTTFSISIPQR